jgi:hypothetical protein
MIYPVAVIVIAGVVVGVILWKVIPTFASCSPASAPSCRCRRASSSRSANNLGDFLVPGHRHRRGAATPFKPLYYETENGRA